MSRKFITQDELKQYQAAGIFNGIKTMDGGFGGLTTPNVNMPAGILTELSPYIVSVITRKRTADEVIGRRMKLLDFEQQDFLMPMVEGKGETVDYSDVGNAPIVGMNPTYIYTGHKRFSINVVNGSLKNAQLAQARINGEAYNMSTGLERLAITFNDIAFTGVPGIPEGSKYPIYGVLNNPDLPAYRATETTTADATFEKFYKDVVGLIEEVISRAQGHVSPNSKMVLAISNRRNGLLSLINQIGNKSIKAAIAESYPNLTWVLAPELDGAYTGGLDVMYLRAESLEETAVKEQGLETDSLVDSSILGFSELARAGAVEVHSNYTLQTISSGSLGTIISRPFMFGRRYFAS